MERKDKIKSIKDMYASREYTIDGLAQKLGCEKNDLNVLLKDLNFQNTIKRNEDNAIKPRNPILIRSDYSWLDNINGDKFVK